MHVRYNKLNVTRICGHFLKPGVNHIPDHLVERVRNDRQFKYAIKTGTMEILGARATVTETGVDIESSGPEPGPEMSVREMLPIIQRIFDPETLDHFESVDNRKTVLQAIARQRRLIAAPEEPEELEDEAITEG